MSQQTEQTDPPSPSSEGWRDRLVAWASTGPRPSSLQEPGDRRFDVLPLGEPVTFATIVTLATFVFAYAAFVLFENRFPTGALEIWRRWDTIHYISIARDGYGTDPDNQFLIIWPPLYPWLIRATRYVAGSYLGAGIFVAFLSYLAAVVGLYRLVGLDFPQRIAMRSVIYLSIFPVAYFFHAAYTEPLFVALIVWSFLFARRKNWLLAGLLGGLASLTRITAFGLLPALLFEYLLGKKFRLRATRADVLWLALIPAGFGIYLWINYTVYGDPLAFMEMARTKMHKVLAAPWVGAENVWSSGKAYGPNRFLVVSVSEILAGVLSGVFVLIAFARLRTSYGIFMFLSWANFAFTSFWASTARYLLPLFPGFILLALWGERRTVHFSLCLGFVMAYTLLLTLFIRGSWAF